MGVAADILAEPVMFFNSQWRPLMTSWKDRTLGAWWEEELARS